jgi:hypothetical protein
MEACRHTDLEFIGYEKSDVGQNKYMRCRSCHRLIVVTAEGRIISVKGIDETHTQSGDSKTHPE